MAKLQTWHPSWGSSLACCTTSLNLCQPAAPSGRSEQQRVLAFDTIYHWFSLRWIYAFLPVGQHRHTCTHLTTTTLHLFYWEDFQKRPSAALISPLSTVRLLGAADVPNSRYTRAVEEISKSFIQIWDLRIHPIQEERVLHYPATVIIRSHLWTQLCQGPGCLYEISQKSKYVEGIQLVGFWWTGVPPSATQRFMSSTRPR